MAAAAVKSKSGQICGRAGGGGGAPGPDGVDLRFVAAAGGEDLREMTRREDSCRRDKKAGDGCVGDKKGRGQPSER